MGNLKSKQKYMFSLESWKYISFNSEDKLKSFEDMLTNNTTITALVWIIQKTKDFS